MYCTKCGFPVGEKAAFCMKCGAPVTAQPSQSWDTSEPISFCTKCGTRAVATDPFCRICGTQMMAPAEPPSARQRRLYYMFLAGIITFLLLLTAAGLVVHQNWSHQGELKAHYDWGLVAYQAGNLDTALIELAWVKEHDPDYEQVQSYLDKTRSQIELDGLYAQAQAYFDQHEWDLAIETLEALRQRATEYEAEATSSLLFTSYLNSGQALADKEMFVEAVQRYDQCLTLRSDAPVEQKKKLATLYPQGLEALKQKDYAVAIDALRQVHATDRDYHSIVDKLYEAYMGQCSEHADSKDLARAEAACLSAREVNPDGGWAIAQLTQIAFLRTPTLTPTLTPTVQVTETITFTDGITSTITDTSTDTDTDISAVTDTEKESTVACRAAKKGRIGFKRQDRCNPVGGDACGPVQIWVMDADGSNQAPMCDPSDYAWALKKDQTHPDGTWYVDVVRNQGNDIRRVFNDGRKEWLIVNNRGDWDPVLSADGWWLAWVTNRNANDEIYIKTVDIRDNNQRRLTVNEWQWDKHPTWSPDGRKIAFYSNRANKLNEATRQIWVMDIVNDQGTNFKNLSKRPNKVDTDPVWFKWDNIP